MSYVNQPLTWRSAVVDALREYHYGQAHLLNVAVRPKVELYLQRIEEVLKLHEELLAAASDGFWFPTPRPRGRSADLSSMLDAQSRALKPIHNDGTLYTIKRKDADAKNRIFITKMAIAHNQLFHRSYTQSIVDLFYLEGMGRAPAPRSVERIAKEAIKCYYAKYRCEKKIEEELKKAMGATVKTPKTGQQLSDS